MQDSEKSFPATSKRTPWNKGSLSGRLDDTASLDSFITS
jgi:hypothetical protein